MLFRFCLYGFLKNQRYFEPFLMLALIEHGLSFFWIGVLVAIRSFTVNLLEIPSGALADTWGRRGTMIASFLAYIASFLTFAFSSSFPLLSLAMIAFGIGDSFRTGTHKAMIFEWLRLEGREDEKTIVYGTTRSWSKFGSATSATLAAMFVIFSGNYRTVFLLATLPYLINVINFFGYPPELEGPEPPTKRSLRATWRTLTSTIKRSFSNPALRRLISESMCWEGVFHAVKDYLQPVLAALVFVALAGANSESSTTTVTAILIGAIYSTLFFLSALASRWSGQFVIWRRGEENAAGDLWRINFVLFVLFTVLGWFEITLALVLIFVALNMLQNLWRPILISRFDSHSDPAYGATLLSIESGAHRLTTLIVAPLVGYWLDWTQNFGSAEYWPIGLIGGLAAFGMLATRQKSRT